MNSALENQMLTPAANWSPMIED